MERKKLSSFDFLKYYDGTYTSLEKLLPLKVDLEYVESFLKNVKKMKDLSQDLETYEKEKTRYTDVSLKVKLLYFAVHLSHCFYRKDFNTIKHFVPCEKKPYVWLDFSPKEVVKLMNETVINVIVHVVKSVREMETHKFHFGNQKDPDFYFQFSYRMDLSPPVIQFVRSRPNTLILLLTIEMKFFKCVDQNMNEVSTNHIF